MKFLNFRQISFIICLFIALLVTAKYKEENLLLSKLENKTIDFFTPALSFSSSAINYCSNFLDNFGSIFTVFTDNKNLKERNKFLEEYYYQYKIIEGENQELRKQINLKEEIKHNYLTAQVIGRSSDNVIVNVGANSGLKKWQMVLADKNLIGRVIEVNEDSAIVLLISAFESKIPATGVDSRTKFIASGQNLSFLTCDYLNDKKLQERELVITSGDYPDILPNIPIGKVMVEDNDFYIKPIIDFSQLEFVQILLP
jgi:rod shape-determining protein MreC